MDGVEIAIAIVVLVVVFIFGVALGHAYGVKGELQAAVEAHVGRWTIEERTGNRAFVYGVVPNVIEGKP